MYTNTIFTVLLLTNTVSCSQKHDETSVANVILVETISDSNRHLFHENILAFIDYINITNSEENNYNDLYSCFYSNYELKLFNEKIMSFIIELKQEDIQYSNPIQIKQYYQITYANSPINKNLNLLDAKEESTIANKILLLSIEKCFKNFFSVIDDVKNKNHEHTKKAINLENQIMKIADNNTLKRHKKKINQANISHKDGTFGEDKINRKLSKRINTYNKVKKSKSKSKSNCKFENIKKEFNSIQSYNKDSNEKFLASKIIFIESFCVIQTDTKLKTSSFVIILRKFSMKLLIYVNNFYFLNIIELINLVKKNGVDEIISYINIFCYSDIELISNLEQRCLKILFGDNELEKDNIYDKFEYKLYKINMREPGNANFKNLFEVSPIFETKIIQNLLNLNKFNHKHGIFSNERIKKVYKNFCQIQNILKNYNFLYYVKEKKMEIYIFFSDLSNMNKLMICEYLFSDFFKKKFENFRHNSFRKTSCINDSKNPEKANKFFRDSIRDCVIYFESCFYLHVLKSLYLSFSNEKLEKECKVSEDTNIICTNLLLLIQYYHKKYVEEKSPFIKDKESMLYQDFILNKK